uniref:Uncharacterized protein n=1 Tax=Panagrolaimus sp. ES5 TaxID=591445 RepID=A0AC34GS48_9BILA
MPQFNSTLSCHISEYENSVESNKNEKDLKNQNLDKSASGKTTGKDINQLLVQPPSISYFEIPRQQKEGKGKDPEVMQFKASQKLLKPKKKKDEKGK